MVNECWRCGVQNVQLGRDPMVGDRIGVCYPCSVQRQFIAERDAAEGAAVRFIDNGNGH